MHPTTGRTVVVTGAGSGIGEACALHLDRIGFRVFAGVRKEVDGEALCRRASDRLTPVLLDVTDTAAIALAAETVASAVGGRGLSGLVNNAGIAAAGPLEFLPIPELRRQFEVNVIGQVAVTQAFLPLLRQQRGRIVNMGSVSGRTALPFTGAYCASKFALEALTDALRMEVRPWGILVSVVEPGVVATPMWEASRVTGDEVQRNLPQHATDLYGRAITNMRKYAAKMASDGIPADEVAKVVAHALTSKRPRTRYLVGWNARLRAALRFVPDGMRDRIIVRQLLESP
jgi:NAD(P)-dependent dehydrogenase (short-subunit alcohol dehydrogenase family)